MTKEEFAAITVDTSVDARGTSCPGPLLAAKKTMGQIDSGQVLEVLSADEGTKRDIPKWCIKKKHNFLGIYEEDSFSRLFIQKG
jgi:TusA-related sulfurtransferase